MTGAKATALLSGCFIVLGCNQTETVAGSAQPAQICASQGTREAVLAEIVKRTVPAQISHPLLPDARSLQPILAFERVTADTVDAATGALACSADLVVKGLPTGANVAIPGDLEAVPASGPAVRLRYSIKRQADHSTPIYELQQANSIAEFVLSHYLLLKAPTSDTSELQKPTVLATPSDAVRRLLAAAEEENGLCRGGMGDQERTMRACNRRQVAMKQLQDAGWCWGGAEIEAEKRFIPCKPGDADYFPGGFDEPYYSEREIEETLAAAEAPETNAY